jgi:hypothetical protein
MTPARIVTTRVDPQGLPWLAMGAPALFSDDQSDLLSALRPDLGPFTVERAGPVVRSVPRDEPTPHPETCVPYREANGLGFLLRTRLPLLFVRSRRGGLVADAATALAYARANEAEFATELEEIQRSARDVLDTQVLDGYTEARRRRVCDLAQPYQTFGQGFFALAAGLYVESPDGIGTVIGPLLNRQNPLAVVAGMVRTDWHHHGLFAVIEAPRVERRALLVPAGTAVAQLYFAAYLETADAIVEHSTSDRGGQPAYEERWQSTLRTLAEADRGVRSVKDGLSSVSLSCGHCAAAVSQAVDGDLPTGHARHGLFVPAYKQLQPPILTRTCKKPST